MKERESANKTPETINGDICTSPDSMFGRGLLLLTGGQVIQLVGDHALTVAISAFTYGMTGSTWAYALQQLVMFAPWLLFSAVAGPLIDRLDRRKVLVVADVTRALIVLAYPLCRTFKPILALNFIGSVCRVFSMTARTALIPRLCTKDALLKVNGIRTSVLGIVDLTIPTLAGVIIARVGAVKAFPFTTLASIVGASLYALISPHLGRAPVSSAPAASAPAKQRSSCEQPEQHTSHRKAIQEAVAFMKGDKTLLTLILLYCVYATGQNGVNSIFYPFLESVLHGGPAEFGLSISLYFGANLVAGLLLARFGKAVRRIPAAAIAAVPTLSWIAHSFIRRIPVILCLGFVEGLTFSILTNLLTTEVQSRAPADMTGRVWGLTQTLTSGSEVCGIVVAGTIGEGFGPAIGFRALGLLGLAAMIGAFLLSRSQARRQSVKEVELGRVAGR